jgi:membrane fusion protein (multidrug efflux system)
MLRNLAAVIVIAAGASALASCSKGDGAGGPGGFQMPPTPVEIAKVTRGSVADRFEAVGSMEAGEEVVVTAEVQGQIESLPFVEGSAVREGQLLAKLDDGEWKAEVDRAQALRDQQQAAYDRWESVVEQKAGAQQDLDDAHARLRVAEADLSLAQTRLDKAHITAPFSGVAGARRVSPGAFVNPGDPIVSLAKMDVIRVTFSAPERFVPALKRGAKVTIGVTAYPNETWTGNIDVVDPVLDSQTRSVKILARVRNPDAKLRPGMSANISAILSERPEALVIPSEAVFAEGDQFFVYVVKPDSTVSRVALTLGTRTPESVEVLGQLEEGAMIVRAGHQKLFEGAKVMPIPAGGAAPGGPPGGAGGVEGAGGHGGGEGGADEPGGGSGAAGGAGQDSASTGQPAGGAAAESTTS